MHALVFRITINNREEADRLLTSSSFPAFAEL